MKRWFSQMLLPGLLGALLLLGAAGSPCPQAQTARQRPISDQDLAPHLLSDDVRLGLEVAMMFAKLIGVQEDPEALARLSRIGYRIAAVSGDHRNAYSFQILDLPEPNAMALPGGFIFVTRGMLETGLTDDELAHLLGHELAHVRERHFARAARLNTLMSVLQTALTVGLLLSVDHGASTQQVERSEDPGLRQNWSVGMTGAQAVFQGTSIFGSVVRALFDRGYSRKLEFEADEVGNHLAVAAGYRPEGGVSLMEKLHERSYEGNRFSYWRTHPYFDDRVIRSRARAVRLQMPESPPSATSYREDLALFFARAAGEVRHEGAAVFLYACALRAEPRGMASLNVAHEMLRFKRHREERRHRLYRSYYPILAQYDTLLTHAAELRPEWDELPRIRAERAELAQEWERVLPDYLEVIESDASTDVLEHFLENYPDHARAPAVAHLLAEHYLLTDRPDHTIDLLVPRLEQNRQAPLADSTARLLERAVSEADDLEACFAMTRIEAPGLTAQQTESLRAAAASRMDTLVEEETAFDKAGRFLQAHPETRWAEVLRERVWTLAREVYESGRVSEGLRSYQKALDAYFLILALAPEAPVADEAERGIQRLNLREEFQD